MPELPEVETICKGISPYLLNQTIKQIIVRDCRLRWPVETKALQKTLINQPITKVSRRAKYILIHVPTGFLIIHLGMSGTLRILCDKTSLRKHDHFDCVLSSGNILRYNDPRRFGAILCAQTANNVPQLATLGPEPFNDRIDGKYLHQLAQKRRCAVKIFIMNARIVVGVGNIYANESLFSARIHPQHPVNELSATKFNHLLLAIQEVLTAAINSGGTTLKDFYQSDGKPGYFSQELKVYHRKGLPCFTCQTPIQTMQVGQRATYYCPKCQKLP